MHALQAIYSWVVFVMYPVFSSNNSSVIFEAGLHWSPCILQYLGAGVQWHACIQGVRFVYIDALCWTR